MVRWVRLVADARMIWRSWISMLVSIRVRSDRISGTAGRERYLASPVAVMPGPSKTSFGIGGKTGILGFMLKTSSLTHSISCSLTCWRAGNDARP